MSTVTIDPNAVETSPIEDAQAVSSISGNEKLLAFVGGQLKTFSRSKIKEFVGAISAFEGEKTLKKVIDYTTGTPDFEAPLLEDQVYFLRGNLSETEETVQDDLGNGLEDVTVKHVAFIGQRAILADEHDFPLIGNHFRNFTYEEKLVCNEAGDVLFHSVKNGRADREAIQLYEFNTFHPTILHINVKSEINLYAASDFYTKVSIDDQGAITTIL